MKSSVFVLLYLGMLSAFGPFVMDMYLPTLPAMSDFFHTSPSMVQLGLTSSMIGLAVGQLIFGPLSDRYGRHRPLVVAMALFLLSTLGCIFARDIMQFVALRLVQGIAGAGGVVLSRSIATDKCPSHELARTMALIGAVNGIATVAAPVGGGMMAHVGGWQGIFWLLFLFGALLLAGALRMGETLPRERRQAASWTDMGRRFAEVLRNRLYVGYVLQYGFTMGVLFVNIASAPFIMQEHYGLTPMMFSVCFGANSVAMLLASTLSVKLSMERALRVGSRGMVVCAGLIFAALCTGCDFWVYETLLFGLLSMVGMSFTASNTLAMNAERDNAGIASALLGAVCYVVGGAVSPLVSLGEMTVTAGGLFLVGSLCAYLCARYVLLRSVSSMACN